MKRLANFLIFLQAISVAVTAPIELHKLRHRKLHTDFQPEETNCDNHKSAPECESGSFKNNPEREPTCLTKWRNQTYFDIVQECARAAKFQCETEMVDPPSSYMAMEGSKKKKVGPYAEVLVSEVNIDNPGQNDRQFIELEVTQLPTTGRPKQNILDGFYLLVLDTNPLSIVLSIHLGDQFSSVDPFRRFIVIGSKLVANNNIDVNLPKIHNSNKNLENKDLFPSGNTGPVGIIVAYHPDKPNRIDFSLFKSPLHHYLPTDISNNIHKQSLIKSYAQDLVVIGRKSATSGCTFFDEIFAYHGEIPGRYILRDWDAETGTEDSSINRCSKEGKGFQPKSFMLGPLTPGSENVCQAVSFFLEDIIDEIAPYDASQTVDNPVPGCRTEVGIPTSRYNSIQDDKVRAMWDKYSKSPLSNCPYKVVEQPSSETGQNKAQTPDFEFTPHSFNSDWPSLCREYLPNQGRVLGQRNVLSWIDVEVTETSCKFSCFNCKRYFSDGFRVDFKAKYNIQEASGFFSDSKKVNQEQILGHVNHAMHIEATEYVQRLEKARGHDQLVKVFTDQEEKDLAIYMPTLRMLQFVYAEIMANVSYLKHTLFMHTLTQMGVNVGFRHFTDKAARKMTAMFSDSFHERLLRALVRSGAPFSLLADGTSYRGTAYLVVLLQTVENGKPVVYFYCLIPLEGEKGIEMAESVKQQVQRDDKIVGGWEDHFRSNLVAQVSDSASNMVGQRNSFYSHLSAYVGRKIGLFKCANHVLQLAIRKAMKIATEKSPTVLGGEPKMFFHSFGSLSNELYTFYHSRGSKRFQHLVDLAETMGLHAVRLKYFFDIRWAASHKAAMSALHKDYDLLIADLMLISGDATFEKKPRETALRLHTEISDKTFVLCLNEFVDILSVYEKMSLLFQKQAGILLSKAEVVRTGIRDIQAQKLRPGDTLRTFLAECLCAGVCDRTCTLQQAEDCPMLLRNGKPLLQTNPDAIKLSEYREKLYDSLEQELRNYFPMTVLDAFNIFNPQYFKFQCPTISPAADPLCSDLDKCYTFPRDVDNPQSPEEKLKSVCDFYFLDETNCNAIKAEWPNLLSSIIRSEFLIKFQHEDPSAFWPLALSQGTLTWSPTTKRMIECILATGFSNADSERAFSTANRIQYKERSSLSSENLQHLVRVKINGPPLEKLDMISYTKIWFKSHVRVDDKNNKSGRRPNLALLKGEFSKSEIF